MALLCTRWKALHFGENRLGNSPQGVCYLINPFRTTVPSWGQTTLIPSSLSPKRDYGPKRDTRAVGVPSHEVV